RGSRSVRRRSITPIDTPWAARNPNTPMRWTKTHHWYIWRTPKDGQGLAGFYGTKPERPATLMRPMIAKSNLSLEDARRRAALVRDVTYRVALDLTGESALTAETVVRFRCSGPGAETFLDVAAAEVRTIELNGSRLPAQAWTGTPVLLPGLPVENEVRIVASCAYNRTELGRHRFVDPAGGHVYLHTHFEPLGPHRVPARV